MGIRLLVMTMLRRCLIRSTYRSCGAGVGDDGRDARSSRGDLLRTSVVGVTPNYFAVNNLEELESGDSLTEADQETRARVAVLGSDAAQTCSLIVFPLVN